ncbi:MAG: hypothetical protein QM764_20915 [Chitinophagaceae bacterium]
MKSHELSDSAIHLAKSTINDPKPMILTHWIETNATGHIIRYNAYETIKDTDYDLPAATPVQYKIVAEHARQKLTDGNYTHVIIACSGWNNYQDDSADLYENWTQFTKSAAEGSGTTFNPFLIGFTWASRWIIPGISIWDKANDADELGMTHVNRLIWKFLLPALSDLDIPVITIGHSFGARVLSRAIHSRFLQKNVDLSTTIDKAIDFQGAYPYTRFCAKKGFNGGLYTVDIPVKKHFMTYSEFDYAVKHAFWSLGYVADDKSEPALRNDAVAKNNFEFTAINDAGKFTADPGAKQKVLVDAKAIIKTLKKGAGAHNDVRDKEAGQLIWEIIKP